MKILNISAQKPNSTGSGVYLTELVNNLSLLGHQQAVVAGVYEDDCVSFDSAIDFYPVYFGEDTDMNFNIFGMSDEMPYKSELYRDMSQAQFDTFSDVFTSKIDEAIQDLNPDLIICHHLYLLTALVRKNFPNKKIIGISHGTDLRQLYKHGNHKDLILEFIPKLDLIFALHDQQKIDISKVFKIKDENKIKTLGIGYKNNVFHIRKKAVYNIIFAGKISKQKGICSLLEALDDENLSKYNDNQIVLNLAGGYGNAEEYHKIVEKAKKSRFKINFLGRLNQHELAGYYNENDIFVLPSFYEGLPLVIIEALACGLKVISTDLPGVKAWIDANVKYNNITYIPLPVMKNVDEPLANELPRFQKNIAYALIKNFDKLEAERNEKVVDVSKISWNNIARKLIYYTNDI